MKGKLEIDTSASINRLKILTSRIVNSQIVGNYRSVFKGHGLEFHDYRPYTPTDDASTIDWKASVRSKKPLVREFIQERNLNIFFLIDASSSMVYSSIDKLKLEYTAELAATLSYIVLQAGDSTGFAMFNDKIKIYDYPKQGFNQYYKFARVLVDPKNYGGNYNLVEALKFTMAFLKEFSIVIIISDFIGLKNDWKHYLKLVGKKFDLIGIMICDPIEIELPEYNGQVILGDTFSEKQVLVNVQSIRESYKKYEESQQKMVNEAFMQANADFLELTTDKPFIKPITDLFLRRASRRR
ncbi:MAG: DUF58 domain-containing protein [Nanoarchaeota archaeon]